MTQLRRWREVVAETGNERVELLAQDAIRELEALQDAMLIGHFQDAIDAVYQSPTNVEIKKALLRAKAWISNPDPVVLTPEIASALADDVIGFAAEIVLLRQQRRELTEQRNKLFADYVMSRLDP